MKKYPGKEVEVINYMKKLALLASLLIPILHKRGKPSAISQKILEGAQKAMRFKGGGLVAWESENGIKICVTCGLGRSVAGIWRNNIKKSHRDIPKPVKGRGKKKNSIYENEKIIESLCSSFLEKTGIAKEKIIFWPLRWCEGGGCLMMLFDEETKISKEFERVGISFMSLIMSNITLRSRAKTRLEDYQRIFKNSLDMVYLSTRDGRWVEVNQAGVDMLGYESKEELLDIPDIGRASYLKAHDRARFQKSIEKNGFVKDYEVTFKKKDGSPVEVSITAQVRKEDGKITGYEGIIKDITEKKRQKEREDRQHRLTEAILELVPVAIFVVDKYHRVLYWNRACEELTKTPRRGIVGTRNVYKVFQRPEGVSLADVVLDGDLDTMKNIYGEGRLRKSALSSEAWEAEAHFENLGGREKDLIFSAATLRDQNGKIMGAVEAILDSSQIKKLERVLEEREKMYRTLVESNQDGLILHDGNQFVVSNQAFLKMFDLKTLEEAPSHFMELLDHESRLAFLSWARQTEKKRRSKECFEGHGIRKNERFDLEVYCASVPHKGKEATLFTVRDVTYRKQMEEQLIRSERLAATGKLAFDIAHEVNTPLGGIITYAYLLNEDLADDHEKVVTVDKIIKLANRCKIIIRGLLDFARQDREENILLDLNQIIREMLSLIEGHLILKNVDLQLELQEKLPLVQGNRVKLEQVFLNLVINAAESMEGKGKLGIRTSSVDGKGLVSVQISDEGPGISEEVAKRIFEPFFTTKDRGRGTGLGLAISHGIIKAHQGTMNMKSRVGKGTIFTVNLPAANPILQEN